MMFSFVRRLSFSISLLTVMMSMEPAWGAAAADQSDTSWLVNYPHRILSPFAGETEGDYAIREVQVQTQRRIAASAREEAQRDVIHFLQFKVRRVPLVDSPREMDSSLPSWYANYYLWAFFPPLPHETEKEWAKREAKKQAENFVAITDYFIKINEAKLGKIKRENEDLSCATRAHCKNDASKASLPQ